MENFDWTAFLIQLAICWIFFRLGQASMLKSIAKDLAESLRSKGIELGLDQNGELQVKQQVGALTLMVIERNGHMYYAYTDAGDFLAQGADFATLFTLIKTRFPDRSFKVSKEQHKLSQEEITLMTASIFEIFGDKQNDNQTGQHLG